MAKTPRILSVWQCFPHQDLYVILLQLEPTEVKLWRLCLDQTVAFQFGIYFCEGNKKKKCKCNCRKLLEHRLFEPAKRFSVHELGLNQYKRGSN